jgi:predicted SnoaL-like aldol condensation-catalyzing enzyme
MSLKKTLCSLIAVSTLFSLTSQIEAAVVDIFISAGQSNANAGSKVFGIGAEEALKKSGVYSNVVVVKTAHSGNAITQWHYKGSLKSNFFIDFFSEFKDKKPMGALEAKIVEVISNGDTPVFRGMFWWQGESNTVTKAMLDSNEVDMIKDFEGIVAGIDAGLKNAGLESTKWNFIVNTVYRSTGHDEVNEALARIASLPRGAIFDTQKGTHRVYPKKSGDPVHGYDHQLVGKRNAELFIATFKKSSQKK